MAFIATHPKAIPPALFPENYSPTTSKSESPDSFRSWQSVSPESYIRPGTPFIKRVSSVRLPDDNSNKALEQLPNLLSLDLQDDTILNDIVDLVDVVFPSSVLPFKVDDTFVDKCRDSLGDTKYKWCHGRVKTSEEELANFLNMLCDAIAEVSGHEVLRKWDAKYCNTILEGSPIRRKPDVVLLDRDFAGIPKWLNVHAIVELTTSYEEHRRIVSTVTDKTYIILGVQPNRIFVPIISAWGGSKFRLTVTDRQGQLRTKTFDIAGGMRRADLRILIHILVCLCFGCVKAMGYDESMIMGCDGVEVISCDKKEFRVINLIYATQSLIGRATRVWMVEYNKQKFILKDSWVEKCRPVSEVEHLNEVAGVEGVPTLFCAEDIPDVSTGNLRRSLVVKETRERIRRRIVTSSCGSHIADFNSKRELISALKDIVVILKTLAEDKGLVHRDISYNNILLQMPQGEDEKKKVFRRGLLIDLEYAASLVTAQSTAPGRRTGTVPFMAVELLMEGSNATHKPSHDLESLFYVLIFICTNLEGPGTPRSLESLIAFTSLPIASWFVPETSFEGLATDKLGVAHAFEKRILKYFSPYFSDIKPCVRELFVAMYPNGPQLKSSLTHDRMIEIFTTTLESLPSPDQHVPEKRMKIVKQSLSIFDNCVYKSRHSRKRRRILESSTSTTSTPLEEVTPTKKNRARRHRQSISESA